jgi:hypothetical protein
MLTVRISAVKLNMCSQNPLSVVDVRGHFNGCVDTLDSPEECSSALNGYGRSACALAEKELHSTNGEIG